MNRMSCSMTTTASPMSRILKIRSMASSVSLRVHAGRRLVQQDELRVGGQGPRDLEATLVAVGEVASQVFAVLPNPT
jgi:hypothetical protein